MNYSLLKKVRVIISLAFFFFISLIFLDVSFTLPEKLAEYPLYLQFIPSVIKFISIGGIAAAGFIFVIILTLLFGRVYCSSVCPLGILQDIVTYLRKKIRKVNFLFTRPFTKTRYIILVVSILIFLFGSVFALNILDPYSNFGRILANLIRPIVIGINNTTAFTLESFNTYWIYPVELKGIHIFSVSFSLGVLILVVWMSYKFGRLYCNTICPVGTLLGFLSKYSLFQIVIDKPNCKGCGVCERVCKANCIDTENTYIDFSRCVSCFNCFTVCPTAGIEYKFKYSSSIRNEQKFDFEKRDFLIKSAIYFIGANAVIKAQQKIEVYKENTIPVIREFAVSPPGSYSIQNFTDKCTACHLCVTACPTHVLQPSFLEYGFLGILQPRMDFITGFCNYDCVICTDVCPTGAILPQNQDDKKLIQLGIAKFIRDNCIVYTQGTDCGACAEHCPTKAVRMVLDPEVNKNAPQVNEEICIGCGACEYACPTIPYKAIYVKSNPLHHIAQKPVQEKLDEVDLEEDFPF